MILPSEPPDRGVSAGAYGVAPGRDGFCVAELSCTPLAPGQGIDGVYSESAVAVVLTGAFRYASVNGAAMAVPGALLFANKGEAFSCRHLSTEPNRRALIFLSNTLIEAIAADLHIDARFAAAAAPPSRLTPLMGGLMVRIASGARDSEELAMALAGAALRHRHGVAPDHAAAPADLRGVIGAVRYINTNYTSACSLETLAAVAGMSRFRFARRFRAIAGETAAQYVINRRLCDAAGRLVASDCAISEIALDVGFNDLSHFNASFKAALGCTPGAWRRGQRPAGARLPLA